LLLDQGDLGAEHIDPGSPGEAPKFSKDGDRGARSARSSLYRHGRSGVKR